ncbi:MAG TPA: 4Fe-4S dicluster domain-containing protein [Rhizobiales bacterium]|nr:4Fe-4S dicluster domain-containing protein [Hyphomicrobiales bacterium]
MTRFSLRDAYIDQTRRDFLKKAGAGVATLTLAPGVTLMAYPQPSEARAPDQPADPKNRWGLLIDVSRCGDDCSACVTACSEENGWKLNGDPRVDAQWIRKLTIKNPKSGFSESFPVMCQHCSEPPCTDVCPTGASFKRADGIVLVDKHICIGCRYCMMACPYKARSFIHEPLENQRAHAPRGKGTVESCTLCVHRVDRGDQPACVEKCGTKGNGALLFGDLNDPDSEISKRIATYPTKQIRADLGVDPGVRYQNL